MTSALTSLIGLLLATTGGTDLSPGLPLSPPTRSETAPVAGVWPLDPQPTVVSGFDPPLSKYGSGHRGVDLAGAPGQRVRAAAAGRVTYAGSLAGRGVVVVSHGATRTTYQPVRATVEVGALVDAGDAIGRLERSGSHCAPTICLHWGLIEGESYLDPLTMVGVGPVRLLPFFGLPGGLPVPGPGKGGALFSGPRLPRE